MKQALIETWKNDPKKGLLEVRRRITKAFKNPSKVEINPDSYLFGNTHGITFKIGNDKVVISGEVRIDE